ncbi:MAG: GNAT family N-acetyltransferase [Rhizonema sp. PD38]|nr:GNAT family N-acetyltransferase [Rhizonema sp. PD38]
MRVLTNAGKYVNIQPLAESEIPILTNELLKCERLINHHQRFYLQCEGKCFYFIAWDETLPVGHAIVYWDSDMVFEPQAVRNLHIPRIEDLWVMPHRRGEGIASKLMDCVEASAKERGFSKIGLDVRLSYHLARRIYQKRGYKNTGIPAYELRGVSIINGKEYFWLEPNCIFLIKRLLAMQK